MPRLFFFKAVRCLCQLQKCVHASTVGTILSFFVFKRKKSMKYQYFSTEANVWITVCCKEKDGCLECAESVSVQIITNQGEMQLWPTSCRVPKKSMRLI